MRARQSTSLRDTRPARMSGPARLVQTLCGTPQQPGVGCRRAGRPHSDRHRPAGRSAPRTPEGLHRGKCTRALSGAVSASRRARSNASCAAATETGWSSHLMNGRMSAPLIARGMNPNRSTGGAWRHRAARRRRGSAWARGRTRRCRSPCWRASVRHCCARRPPWRGRLPCSSRGPQRPRSPRADTAAWWAAGCPGD